VQLFLDVKIFIHREMMMLKLTILTLRSVGFFTGFLVSSIMTSAFGGVANAIIVCFAEHPKALGIVHPVSMMSPYIADARELFNAVSN
jgi:hypothetical protein